MTLLQTISLTRRPEKMVTRNNVKITTTTKTKTKHISACYTGIILRTAPNSAKP